MKSRLNIYVLVSTIDDGIRRVPGVLLPPAEGVRYVVSWQQTSTTVSDHSELPE